MSSSIQNLTDRNFAEVVLESPGVVLVDFWAPWCAPCNALTPTINALADSLGERVTVAKVNVDDAPQLAGQYGVSAIPTVILFRDGAAIRQWSGIEQRETYEAAILSVLRAA